MNSKKIITLFSVLCFCSFCYSQQINLSPTEELVYHKGCITSSAFIFEGYVTKQQSYYGKNKAIYTCSIFQITKIYKGTPQINLGTIKIITLGGQIENGPTSTISEGGGVGLAKHTTYIVFSKSAYPDMVVDSMLSTDNTITSTTVDCVTPIVFPPKRYKNGHLIPMDLPAARWDNTKYKTIDEVYAFLKENGLKVLAEIPQIPIQSDSTSH